MKSKLVLLACLGTLALGASAHAATSKTKVPPNAPRSHAVAKDSTAKAANLTKARPNAVGPHAPVGVVLDKR
jgi:hypothetical protein